MLFFCVAVGLATYPTPWGAMEPAVATAMVISLLQQSRELVAWQPTQLSTGKELVFARRFAILWRLLIATTIVACVIVQMLMVKRLFQFSERDDYFPIELVTQGILPVCIAIVLCNSVLRWRPHGRPTRMRPFRVVLLSGFAVLLSLLILIHESGIEYFVHHAAASIEEAAPREFKRPGVYPSLGAEGYFPIWLAFGAVISLIAAAVLSFRLVKSDRIMLPWTWLSSISVLLFLIPPSIFCYWYYTIEIHRISPEIAGVGLALVGRDWLMGGGIAIILITACAYQLAKRDSLTTTVSADLAEDLERSAFHESFGGLLLVGGNAMSSLVSYVLGFAHFRWLVGGTAIFGWFIFLLCAPSTFLLVASTVASFQLCWLRWKRRNERVSWNIAGLSPVAFFQAWMLLAPILVVGIPTLQAFGFLLWLGPIDLLSFLR